ncbi:hypothetical protein AGMMS49953_03100 [Endomicrobiia bacterium]|nr:hypothetical protein AGMMS49953_03100 [Endomicrobiia bacterium]
MKNKIVILTVLMLVFNSVVFAVQKEDRTMLKGLSPMSMGGVLPQFLMMNMCYFTIQIRRGDCLTQIDIAVNREIDSYLNNKEDFNGFCKYR